MLITGGGGGVGRFLALNFARLNARIVVWDINRDGKIWKMNKKNDAKRLMEEIPIKVYDIHSRLMNRNIIESRDLSGIII